MAHAYTPVCTVQPWHSIVILSMHPLIIIHDIVHIATQVYYNIDTMYTLILIHTEKIIMHWMKLSG